MRGDWENGDTYQDNMCSICFISSRREVDSLHPTYIGSQKKSPKMIPRAPIKDFTKCVASIVLLYSEILGTD